VAGAEAPVGPADTSIATLDAPVGRSEAPAAAPPHASPGAPSEGRGDADLTRSTDAAGQAEADGAVSVSADGAATRAPSAGDPAASEMGGFVYFYAAQTTETTPEKRLPKGDPERRSQGVFTYTIFQT